MQGVPRIQIEAWINKQVAKYWGKRIEKKMEADRKEMEKREQERVLKEKEAKEEFAEEAKQADMKDEEEEANI